MPIKKTLAGLVLSGMALFSPLKATAEEIKLKEDKPKVEINFDYKTESEQKGVDYSKLSTTFLPWPINITNISSSQELIGESETLSESQKLILGSKISSLSRYDLNLQDIEVISQDDFFYNLQNFLPVGVCRHIATHAERSLNDIGIRSAAVSGISGNQIGHVYDISKIEDGTAIIDYNNILTTDTKNIEKTLQAYQKNNGTTTFQHLFFEDTLFEYKLITRDGRRFLDFVGYDESSESLKKALFNNFEPEARLKININVEDYLTSAENNLFGLFVKAGEIRGDSSSPMEKLSLMQTGFKRKFLTPDMNNKFLNFVIGNKIIDLDGNFLLGNLVQDKELDDNRIQGLNGNLVFSTNNERGFNLSSRIAGNICVTKDSALFYDSILGTGVSCKIPIKNTNIEPYVVSQFSFLPKDIGTYKFTPKLSELVAGTVFDFKPSDNINLLVEPYYLRRIWEQEFGINTEIKGKYIGLKIGEHITKSDYDFCPGKFGFDVGLTMDMKEFLMNLSYSINEINYDGEIERQHSLNVKGKIKF